MAAKLMILGSIGRAAYGILALLLPKLLFKSAGMDPDSLDPDARYFNRVLGGRDLVVAGATVAAVKAGAERQAAIANLICEFTDSVALAEELRGGRPLDRTLSVAVAFNVTGYLTWIRGFRAIEHDQ
jgi:hypothetical protein